MKLAVASLGAFGLMLFLSGIPIGRVRRLDRRVEPYVSGLRGMPSSLLASSRAPGRLMALLYRWLRPALPGTTADLISRLRAAGDDRSPDMFRVEQVTWALAGASGAVLLFLAAAASGILRDATAVVPLVVIFAISGFLARDWVLARKIRARRDEIAGELPVAADLITLAVMAGEAVPAACERTAAALGGALGEELSRAVADVRAGEPIAEALEALAVRCNDASVARFVDTLVTGMEKGTPLAEVLRAQADDARDATRRRIIEVAGRKEVLMLVPVVFLIMPVVVVFALYPGLVSLRLLVP